MKLNFLYFFICSIAVCGCASANEIEIRQESSKYVKRNDIGKYIGLDEGLPVVANWSSGDFLVVKMTSSVDLVDFSRKEAVNIHVDASFCEEQKKEVILGTSEVYLDSKSLVDARLEGVKAEDESSYEAVIFLAWDKMRELPPGDKTDSQSHYLVYDLKKEPKDICIVLKGGNPSKLVRSNQVIITASEIKNLLKN